MLITEHKKNLEPVESVFLKPVVEVCQQEHRMIYSVHGMFLGW